MVQDLAKKPGGFQPDDGDIPEHVQQAPIMDDEDIVDPSIALEREDMQRAYIFGGTPPEGTVSRLETYYGTIEQALKDLSKRGDGLYAPRDPEGQAILEQTRERVVGADQFAEYQAAAVASTVEMINSSPVSGFEFVKETDGSFILREKHAEQATNSGGIVQDLDTDKTNDRLDTSSSHER